MRHANSCVNCSHPEDSNFWVIFCTRCWNPWRQVVGEFPEKVRGASAVRCISIPKDSLLLLSVFPSPGRLTAQTVTCVRGDVTDVMTAGPHAVDGNIKKMLRCWSEAESSQARRRLSGGRTGLGVGDGGAADLWIKILVHNKT